jgi:predicted MFS family arabinose efflux permease
MGTRSRTAREEWKDHWPLVLACALGFSLHTVSSYILGLVMEPLEKEFGWSRALISIPSLIPAIIMILLSPSTGAIIDRFGSRRLAIPSLALTGLSLAMISLTTESVLVWCALWLFYGVVSLGIKATVWTAAITGTFDRARGIALGAVMCGVALTQIAVPPLAQWLVDGGGWRSAYIWIGIGWSIPCLVLALFCLYDRHDTARGEGRHQAPSGKFETGLTLAQALRSLPLIRVGVSTLLTMFIGTAVLIHQVPILTTTGIDRAQAAWLASLAGVAGIIGKLASGWMTDRWNAWMVGAINVAIPAVAYIMLLQDGLSLGVAVLSMMIIGYTAGSKLQISAFLTGQYAGMAHFGKIFGVMTSLIGIGGGLGSVAAGAIFDRFGSYDPLLWAGIVVSLLCGALLFKLGSPPRWIEG